MVSRGTVFTRRNFQNCDPIAWPFTCVMIILFTVYVIGISVQKALAVSNVTSVAVRLEIATDLKPVLTPCVFQAQSQ